MKVTCQHIAANSAPMPNCLQFLNADTIAYCFSNQIALYSMDQNAVELNINSRSFNTERANCLKCITLEQQQFILAGYDSGHLVVYANPSQKQWKVLQIIKQGSSIISIHHDGQHLITNNNNAEVIYYRIQQHNQNMLLEKTKLVFPLNKIIQTITSFLMDHYMVMFIAGVDKQIYCYTLNLEENAEFQYRFALSGHENAIMKLVSIQDKNDHLIASCSQDGYIRIWKVTPDVEQAKYHKNVKNLLQSRKVFLDSVLISHECSVTCVSWANFNGLKLISCSLDCTVCVWGRDEEGAWSVDTRMGQFLGNKNAYFNVIPYNKYLVAVNYIGSAMIWVFDQKTNKFTLRPSFNGHSNEVRDLDWSHTGDFLVSISKDQTTRVLAQKANNYHEISRAQIHGYDISAVATLKLKEDLIDLIICGAEEKVLRIVEPPASFANYLNSFTGANLHLYFPTQEEESKYIVRKEPLLYETYAEGGVQVLGLMTKMQKVQREKVVSYYDEEQQEHEMQENQQVNPKDEKIDFSVPPHDDYLVKHTLWPEMNKLYGHPHEISCLTKTLDGSRIASACSGLSKAASTILVWDTKGWKFKPIQYHAYTVNDMVFSNNNKYLVSVSKDRKMGVFDENCELLFGYEAHSRVITSVSVSPNSNFIATGSRDKTIKIHSIQERKPILEFKIEKIVHSLLFCGERDLVCGTEEGHVIFMKWTAENKLQIRYQIDDRVGATKTVSCLKYSRGKLALSSYDHSVRIFRVEFD